jgi:signal transduction histidine kinase
MQSCISESVMTRNAPVVIPDISADARLSQEMYRAASIESLVMVPVRAPQPIAAIGAYWAAPHHASDEEVGGMILLADAVALALSNVRLYQELAATLDREKQARVRAERAVAAKDEFLAFVAHELRQPLHASLAALRMMGVDTSSEQAERARLVVERQVFQMNRLVEDLVDAARIVRGHVDLKLETTDMIQVVRHTTEAVRSMMTERRHDFVVTAPDHSIDVRADSARLQQVFTNLLTNAAKYTEPGGRIAFTVANGSGHVAITVADSGRGISPDALPHIFELFARGAQDVPGFGVGLAVARRLVELHGGTIQARSAGPGQGSEFTVSLPTTRES